MALVEVTHLVKRFVRGRSLFGQGNTITAVNDVSFAIGAGDTFGLVGESGSGKTTTGRCMLRLVEPTAGSVRFRETEILALGPGPLRALRRDMQIMFQDPYSSLNPRMRARQIVEEPLAVHAVGSASDRAGRARELLQLVGLSPGQQEHYPHQFSGGQRQRINLARALALNPCFLILDEPVSALDVSIQGQIVNLVLDLQQRLSLTYLFIAHDLRLVRQVCNRVAVMYRGAIVEMGPTPSIFSEAVHPYTRALLSAIPQIDPDAPRHRMAFDPEIAAPVALREVRRGHWAAV